MESNTLSRILKVSLRNMQLTLVIIASRAGEADLDIQITKKYVRIP